MKTMSLVLVAFVACSSEVPKTLESPPTASVVSASAGGTVTASDGHATLSVPRSALANDVEIKVEVSPKEEGTAGPVYQFQPEGTVFSVAATLSISTRGVVAPAGKTLGLAIRREGQWATLAGAKLVADAIEAPIVTLGAVALVMGEATPQSKCAASCMAQSGAVCCTTCGCQAEVACKPVCNEGFTWDCELTACYNYKTHQRQE